MAITSAGSSGTVSSTVSTTAQARLQKAQQQLAIDLAGKAADKVIANDKAAVASVQREVSQHTQTGGSVDLLL
jgi:hypothetical protein